MASTDQETHRNRPLLLIAAFVAGMLIMAGLAALLINIQQRKAEAVEFPLRVVEVAPDELDPAVWGQNFPRQYDTFMMTQDDTIETPYGGSVPYSKLERYPAMVRLWAGYAFSIDHNEERGHYYAQIDQENTERVQIVEQPGACVNCHAAEAPGLIEEMGWETFNRTPYNELKEHIHLGSSCADCHDPDTMDLRITRPALLNALEAREVDLEQATRQEMRTYVCAQCHVEYYFLGDDKVLTFPWNQGLTIDDIEAHYDAYDFADWTHAETNAPMIKIQHPEFEMWSTGLHASSGVTCADCHMPYVRDGAVKVSDHWLRSPLTNVSQACQTCHQQDEETLSERILTIQNRTAGLLRLTEDAIIDAIDAIVAAQEAGASDEALAEARYLHRRASLRWDFVSSENSTGFHSPQESARILAMALDFARQAQLEAELALSDVR
ncbi:MAG TPA: ammonia-forming cytochrome c nitrite reductase subunit c552 [Candidatus Sulfomarinibacteraceae bacterium]|nr:ammonia-forming cytochrome c nitrite reductase subunit c552 [Candidatus Sulfomarinibacteraceae bacterium]